MSNDAASPRGDALILFGVTGDLGRSKIIPALGQLQRSGRLDGVEVVGVGRSTRSDDEIRSLMEEGLGDDSDGSDLIDRIGLRYVSGDAADRSTFDDLAELLDGAEQPIVYAALPPDVFGDVAQALHESRLPDSTRLVVEKPFGNDAASAEALYRTVTDLIGDDQLCIVDHFLAKAAVENLLTVRTQNALFERLLHRGAVRSITVDMLERGDATGRGSFYEAVGVIDDVVQNHVVQMAALALMECPSDRSDDAYHTARAAAIGAMSIDPDSVVLGQYEGYRSHDGVADDSQVPTYASFSLSVDTERWRGVPIRVTTGKSLDREDTGVTFELDGPVENTIRFGVKPDATISLSIAVLDADADHRDDEAVPLTQQEARLCGPSTHDALDAYATLLDDALAGSRHHFARIDGITAAWELVAALTDGGHELQRYEPGSAGPD